MNVDFHSSDPLEVQRCLERIYAGNRFRFHEADRQASSSIVGSQRGAVGVYDVLHTAPFEFVSEGARSAYLVVLGTQGEGVFRRGDHAFHCGPGSGGVVSVTGESRVTGGQRLGHLSVHIDADRLTEHCGRWLGAELEAPPVFEQVPMSAELLHHWRQAAFGLQCLYRMQWCPESAMQSLTEHALSLLVTMHPHDYSAYLHRRSRLDKRRVREARWLIEHAREPLTESMLASRMGCSVIELAMGFREHAPDTPLETLLRSTWRRGGPGGGHGHGGLGPTQALAVDDYIRRNIADRIRVADLARVAGLGQPHFLSRFRATFGTTPAQYVIHRRIEEAKRLLSETKMSVADIAADTGFSSHSHLSDQFSLRVGESPIAFRGKSRADRPGAAK
ncbi:AraC family transcriptional regulator [Pseudoxanthomonas putridarboris]|uniref:AraC family transcriptional regulator n=1 Tax=Pseudoxanthomonas putridarboris TaxID=752605 RepID=A0ABU9J5B5_9GAMM